MHNYIEVEFTKKQIMYLWHLTNLSDSTMKYVASKSNLKTIQDWFDGNIANVVWHKIDSAVKRMGIAKPGEATNPKPIKVKTGLFEDLEVTIYNDGHVEAGCQIISFKQLTEIYDKANGIQQGVIFEESPNKGEE